MKILYRIGVLLYRFAIYLASFRSQKAAKALAGRKNQALPPAKRNRRYWFHCASLGEFEQARPLMEYYGQKGVEICLTFFSPSGYELRKSWSGASWIGYLPFDSRSNAQAFVEAVQADKVFFVKYEFWYFFLKEIQNSKVPFYLISARLRPEHPFFRWYGGLHREMLQCYTHIFTQDSASIDLLKGVGVTHATFAGDTRFDRVLQMKATRKKLPLIEAFSSGHFTLVAGSCWPPEEKRMEKAFEGFPEMRWILAPHDVSIGHVEEIEARFPGQSIRYSELEKGVPSEGKRVLIVDCIGLLGNIYPYGDAAFVGGGFFNVLHNIIEAAVWGIPVMYGADCKKNPEGKNLAIAGGGYLLEGPDPLPTVLEELSDVSHRMEKGKNAANWVVDNSGATQRILAQINAKA